MNELISRLSAQAGLSQEQAMNAVSTIKDYLSEKFPMLEDVMEKVIGSDDADDGTSEAGSSIASKAGGMIEDVKEKAEEFLGEGKIEDLTEGAKDMAEDAINKLKDMFGKK